MPLRPITLFAFLAAAVVLAAGLVLATLPGATDVRDGGFDRRVRAYLMAHPRVIAEAVAVLRKQNAAAESAVQRTAVRANRAAILSSGPLPVAGNPIGDVTVVEFFDYRCPYCRQSAPQIQAMLAADTGIRLVLKEFPVLGPDSVFASHAAIAASKQGKYLKFHDALMKQGGELTPIAVLHVAREMGLDVERLKADMTTPTIQALIEDTLALAGRLRITGTPTFVIGDELLSGFAGTDEIRSAIARARSR